MYKLKLVSTLIIMSLAILGCEKDPILYDVSLSQSIGGNVLVSQIGTLEKGTIIEFSAEASQNHQFVEWVNSINGKIYTQNPLNLTIDNDSSLELLKKEYEDELLDNGPINSKFITLHKSGEENAIEALLNYINNETDGVKVDFITLAIAPRMNHIEHSCFSSMTTQLILNAKTNILVCKH